MVFAGTLRYDRTATDAQRAEKTIIEYGESSLAEDIRVFWAKVETLVNKPDGVK
jgi:hypothetical protein